MPDLGTIWRDLRYAARSLAKDRGTATLALLALALGIGAATVIVSVVDSTVVNAFPFADSRRVVHFYIQSPERQGRSAYYPLEEFLEYRAQNAVFTRLLGGRSMEVLYQFDDGTYRARGALIDPRAFRELGVTPILGREVSDADGEAGAAPTVVLSDRVWAERFNRDPSVIGTTLTMNGTARTVIAVLPPRFLLHDADLFFPTTIAPGLTDALVGGSSERPLTVWTYGRLRPGVTSEEAAANLRVVAQNVARLNPDRYPDDFRVTVMSLADAYTTTSMRNLVYILAGAVGLLLLIACSNVANLLLARTAARERELAVRASLGASRLGLMRQVLAEGFVLAACGSLLGALIAFLGLQWARSAIPANSLPAEVAIHFSQDALVATIGVTLLTGLLCAIVPAVRASRGNLQQRLSGTGKGTGLRAGPGRLRTVLVAIQMTLAIVLLVGAGLMARTLLSVLTVDPGVDTSGVVVGALAFTPERWAAMDPEVRQQFVQQAVERVRAIPGVVAVSPTSRLPLTGGFRAPIMVDGVEHRGAEGAFLEGVDEDYVRALGLAVVAGRSLSSADVVGARPVAVVNEAFVRAYLDGSFTTGRTVALRGDSPPLEIVGVVEDVRNAGLREPPAAQLLMPHTVSGTSVGLIVRTSGDPNALQARMLDAVWAVDPGVALRDVQTLDEVLRVAYLTAPTFAAGLLGVFAAIALILATVGVFSVTAYAVSLETHDIGVRMALGAEPRSVVRMIVSRGIRPVVIGAALGVAASYWLARLLESQIFGVSATDPATFATVIAALLVAGTIACFLPARRATRIDPLIALRDA